MSARRTKKTFFYLLMLMLFSCILGASLLFLPNWLDNQEYFSLRARKKSTSLQTFPVWGLDISHHNGKVDWSKVIVTKPNFIFIKATEGITISDREYDSNWVYLKKHDIARGAYHFFSYKSTGKLQAQYFISRVKLVKGDLPPVLDVEFANKMPHQKKVTREILNWISVVEKHYKVKPIIYCPWRFYKKYLKGKISEDYPLWICDYRGVPDDDSKWTFWQHTDSFKIPGINFTFDRNVFRYDSVAFKNILIK